MTSIDVRGLALTTNSATALDYFNKSIAANAEYRLSAGDYMAKAIEADPGFVMAHCVMGYYMVGAEALAPAGAGRACLDAAEALDLSRVSARERAHVKALRAWVEGRQDDAILVWDRILDDHPTDLLALQLVHYRNFWHGKAMAIRDSVARHFHAWDERTPNYSNVLGMYSFGLNENGDKVRAEKLGRQAIELNRDDLWAVHAVAHVLNDVGEQKEGLRFLNQFDKSWGDRNAIREHLWWHEALFEWELSNHARVLELYDNYFAKNVTPFYLDIQNTASILWRLESSGIDVGPRWSQLGEAAAKRAVARNIPFTDVHVAMVLGRTGRAGEMGGLLQAIRDDAKTARTAREHTAAETNIAVCSAIDAYCRADYGSAVEQLLPGRWNAYRALGASDAQRDVLGVMLGHSALKAGDSNLARSVFAQRVEMKPSSQMNWLWYATALDACQDAGGAKAARAKASTCAGVARH